MKLPIKISEADLHPHIKARMKQRGVSIGEIETVLNRGWDANDAKEGTIGKVLVSSYNADWGGSSLKKKR
ncbi:hypothetical protein JZK55_04050 [Dissulfurispira thermophila]|uniref:Uncharacterized protein n=1 Tax=Dissulfurispira thermophila TaxID=2715679 RepID=A0A7G1GZY2_9BACT|nr:hypothetical protein [Dissulfurispira thermophila]BCB95483.1 hypothetical protein JZK55_04050 [Dissulfurispira thermophila]